MSQDQQAAKIFYSILMSQDFCDWYDVDFQNHVNGEENCKTREQIIQDLKEITQRWDRLAV